MEILRITKTCRIIEPVRVRVVGITDESDESIRSFAIDAADETGRNFGSRVERWDNGEATVTIYRD
jgi:hypothetical protein